MTCKICGCTEDANRGFIKIMFPLPDKLCCVCWNRMFVLIRGYKENVYELFEEIA